MSKKEDTRHVYVTELVQTLFSFEGKSFNRARRQRQVLRILYYYTLNACIFGFLTIFGTRIRNRPHEIIINPTEARKCLISDGMFDWIIVYSSITCAIEAGLATVACEQCVYAIQ